MTAAGTLARRGRDHGHRHPAGQIRRRPDQREQLHPRLQRLSPRVLDEDYYAPLDQPDATAREATPTTISTTRTPRPSRSTGKGSHLGLLHHPREHRRVLPDGDRRRSARGLGALLQEQGRRRLLGRRVQRRRLGRRRYEWGYSLLPSTMLYTEHFLGWAPDGLPPRPAAGTTTTMGVFITVAQDNTRVFVDFNNDGTADQTYTLNRLQTQYVADPDGGTSRGRTSGRPVRSPWPTAELGQRGQQLPRWTSATWPSRAPTSSPSCSAWTSR